MMILLLRILIAILIALGIWKIASTALLLPGRAIRSRIRNPNGKRSSDEQLREILRVPISLLEKTLPISEYKLHRLEQDFQRLEMSDSPRYFLAFAMAKSLMVCVLGLSFILLGVPWLSLISVVLAILMYAQTSQTIHKQVQKLNQRIESALPRMVDTMEHSLQGNRDLIDFFRRYRKSAGHALGREIDVLLADIRLESLWDSKSGQRPDRDDSIRRIESPRRQTGNQEMALKRMDTRVGSAALSTLVAILCGVNQGIDQQTSLAIFAADLRTKERERLKKQLESSPGRIKAASFILTFLMVGMFMVPLVLMIIETVAGTGL